VTSDDAVNLPLVNRIEDEGEPVEGNAGADNGTVGLDDLVEPEDFEPDDLVEPDELVGPDDLTGDGESFVAGQDEGAAESRPEVDPADLEQESEIAADYVEGLLDVADLDGDIDMDVEGDRALVSVVGATLQELIGPRGEVLEALQELTRLAVHRQTGLRTRIMLDVGGYRIRRRSELAELGQDAAEEVRTSGVPKRLGIMTPFERKVVHDAVAAAGLRSESEGEEPARRVVVFPAG
jgi:spoIIIJ-associated protein